MSPARKLLLGAGYQTTLYPDLTSGYYYRGFSALAQIYQNDRTKDNSLTRRFAGAAGAADLRHGRRQRLESPKPERRRELSVLPLGPPDAGAIRSRAVRAIAEADRFSAVAGRNRSGYGPRLFTNRSTRPPCRIRTLLLRFTT